MVPHLASEKTGEWFDIKRLTMEAQGVGVELMVGAQGVGVGLMVGAQGVGVELMVGPQGIGVELMVGPQGVGVELKVGAYGHGVEVEVTVRMDQINRCLKPCKLLSLQACEGFCAAWLKSHQTSFQQQVDDNADF